MASGEQTTRWVVAVSLNRQLGNGALNIVTDLTIYKAASRAEAVGRAAQDARDRFPDHAIGHFVAMEIPDAE